ncbi:MAG: efflux RND transporter periplasmic adaptor subunit, partial [Planctomycetales bacterium]
SSNTPETPRAGLEPKFSSVTSMNKGTPAARVPGAGRRSEMARFGRVVSTHDSLHAGTLIDKGTQLLEIDRVEYELAQAQLKADIEQVNSQIAELEVQEANSKASLKIGEASLALADRDYQRAKKLADKGTITQAEVDGKEAELLDARQGVQSLKNSLNVLPAKKAALDAVVKVKEASLRQAELNIEKTIINAPMDCRLGQVDIEPGQFLGAGQVLFEAHSIDYAEVEVRLSIDQAQSLIRPTDRQPVSVGVDFTELEKIFGVTAVVRLKTGTGDVEWQGKLHSIREQMDPRTRTVGFVVAVDKPYANLAPGVRPPLAKGMFCEVEFRAKPRPDQIVIPRSSLHGDAVYLVDQENRLRRRKVRVAFLQGNFCCLEDGLQEGERIVVSDPTPAVEGMLVEPVLDEALRASIISQAGGERGSR